MLYMKRRRTKRKWKRVLFLLATLLIIGIFYCVYQYNKGLSVASDGMYKDDGTMFDPFQGEGAAIW